MTYDAAYFIAKFEGIPEEQWCVDYIANLRGQHCALGWCDGSPLDADSETVGLIKLFPNMPKDQEWRIASINDGHDPRYQQPTPKQRVIQALRDLIK